MTDQAPSEPHPRDVGRARAKQVAMPTVAPPARSNPASAGNGGGQLVFDDHGTVASPDNQSAAIGDATLIEDPPQGEAVHTSSDTHTEPDRFADPLVAEIVETWRQRQDMVRAQQKLTLQIKAICRRFTAGDKAEADKLYASMQNGKAHPMAEAAHAATVALLAARVPLEEARKGYEKHLSKLAKGLPIAHMVDEIKGVNYNTLATIVGECGDLSAYEKGVAGIWKRAGLAVIDGQRQRRVGGDEALIHGYSPTRRSTFWNIGAALLKSQGKDENAGPYRKLYDERKAYERERVDTDGHAHNRAMRFMTKRLLKDLWQAWKAAE